jgi:hypothetical protein
MSTKTTFTTKEKALQTVNFAACRHFADEWIAEDAARGARS